MTATTELGPTTGRLSREAFQYAAGGIAGKAAAVILLPILGRALGPAGYGAYDLISTTGSAATVILLLGFDAAATRVAFQGPWIRQRGVLQGTWLALTIVLAVSAFLAFLVGAPWISQVLFGRQDLAGAVRILAVIVPAGLVNFFILTMLRIDGRASTYALLTGAALIGNMVLALVLVGILRLGLEAALLAWAVSLTLTAAIGLWVTLPGRSLGLSSGALRALSRYGFPIAPAIAAVWIAEVVNRTILLDTNGAAAVGLLSVGLRLASVVTLATTAFQLAWQPRAYAARAGKQDLASVAASGQRFVAFGGLLVIGLALVAQPVVAILVGSAYEEAAPLVGLLAAGALLAMVIHVVGLGSALALKSEDLAIATVTAAIVSVAVNAGAAPVLGPAGTASAIVAGQLVGVAVIAIISRRRAIVVVDLTKLTLSLVPPLVVAGVSAVQPGLGLVTALTAFVGAGALLLLLRPASRPSRS